jgi:cyclomaltodextrinase / maltogenic alpha-amylase / neopullulanase
MDQFSPSHWANQAIFYHIYPLGFCGAPPSNDFSAPPVDRLQKVIEWLPHMRDLGMNALYLGPLFESTAHGYDTADYYHVDRRLGTDENLHELSSQLHQQGMRLVLDGVFNHVGRDFWAFRDVREHLTASPYVNWFHNLHFGDHSPYGDPFTYTGWAGNYDLVKLDLRNPEVKDHLFGAIRSWVEEFGIDGLRLDAADCLDLDFLDELHDFVHALKADFWLMGEIVAGDYRTWANPQRLDSVTNYECYKGLYSSLADKNYFEIAYSLNRQFGPEGIYRGLPLYTFADNHDVNRIASNLTDPAHLFPLYCLLFTMPGVPSIYYGSEWGIQGRRTPYDDRMLRPSLDLAAAHQSSLAGDLETAIRRLTGLRHRSEALKFGDYLQVYVTHEQFAFLRMSDRERVLVILNAGASPVPLEFDLPSPALSAVDLLNGEEHFVVSGSHLSLPAIPACWARVLRLE